MYPSNYQSSARVLLRFPLQDIWPSTITGRRLWPLRGVCFFSRQVSDQYLRGHSKASSILRLNVELKLCITVVVVLRVYTRVTYSNFGYDDWITLMCLLMFLATAMSVTLVVTWGFGKHIYDIPATEQSRAREGQVIGTACVILSFASPKFGIMTTVQRATNPPSGFWQRTFYANWALCTASFIFLFAVSIFQFMQCEPVAYQWELIGKGYCIDSEINIRLAYASSAFSTVLDLYFSVLPACIIWKLRTSPRNRLLLSMVLGGASFATIASIVKMWKLGDAISQIADDPTCKFPWR